MKIKALLIYLLPTLILGIGIGLFFAAPKETNKEKIKKAIEKGRASAQEEAQPSDNIVLEKANTGYYTGNGIWAPCAVLFFRNTSGEDVSYPPGIRVEVAFFDKTDGEQLYDGSKLLIGPGSDRRLVAGASHKLYFVSDTGWDRIPFGKDIVAKIYVDKRLVRTVEVNEFEITLTGKKATIFGDEDF